MVVYLFVNRANGKKYVGQTTHKYLCHRLSAHYRAAERGTSDTPFHRAIRKYGREGFEVFVIGKFFNHAQLLEAEKLFIEEHKSFGPGGYNVTAGGEGTIGRGHSEHTRSRIRANHTRPWRGKTHSEATKTKMREAATRRQRSALGAFV